FAYPSTESQVNTKNYDAAVSGLSDGDTFTSRIWWDVK
ncbi:MAG: SusD/RagB family nutrient-binding outer membrane lipoprotein, partial [Bacteroides graminisolvens]|nr:SusD/RagB family nutrient-binding outer membrane lipoprotein [Bacteroides graminisolvens]